jgi:hypothetical protein
MNGTAPIHSNPRGEPRDLVVVAAGRAMRRGGLERGDAMREKVFEWLGWIEKHRVLAAWIAVQATCNNPS